MALQTQVEQLSRHVTDIRRQLDESRRKNDQLEYQLQHHQQQPLWGGAMQVIRTIYVTVEGRNQRFLLLKKKSSKGRKLNFYCKASVMTKVNLD